MSPGPSRTEFEVNPLDGAKELAGAIIGVVDDDEGIRVAVDGLLRSAGFRVVTFSSARALLDSEHLHMLACLILDLHLPDRSEEHTSELQSLMRNSYAVFCLKKK